MKLEKSSADESATTSASSTPDSEVGISDKYVGYLLLFIVLVCLLYVVPEVLVFKQYGFAPVEHLVDTGTNPSLGEILSGLWTDRAQVLNPMNNSLIRFFLVTMVVGVVFDRVKKYSPSIEDSSKPNPQDE